MLFLLLFIFTMAIFVGVTAVAVYLTAVNHRQIAPPENHTEFDEPPQFRSLFETTEVEICGFARAEAVRLHALENERNQQIIQEESEKVRAFQNKYTHSPDRRKTDKLRGKSEF